jgi:hypothetical protein
MLLKKKINDAFVCSCGNSKFSMIEYSGLHPDHYDGVSEYFCLECNNRYGRWTKKLLKEGETEKRYGGQ